LRRPEGRQNTVRFKPPTRKHGAAHLLVSQGDASGHTHAWRPTRPATAGTSDLNRSVTIMATARSDSRLVEVSAGPLFNFVGCAALVLVSIAAVTWGGTTAVGDPAGEIGSGIFLLGALAMLVFALAGRRNVRLFANDALVGCVGLFGGTRVIPRAELVEVRVAWHRYTGKGMGM